jgi:hypothetical protein
MNHWNAATWEIGAGLVLSAALTAVIAWLVFRKHPTAEELERARRLFLVNSGRIVDGMLLDVNEIKSVDAAGGERMLTMLVYSYRMGGVDYECSQDITAIPGIVDPTQIRVGFPCSARYQPGNPQNSIVIAESWSGLRAGLPIFPAYENPESVDLKHLRPGRG